MRLLPEFGFKLLNGWIYFVFYMTIFIITMSTCSKDVRKRLYDRSLWDKKTKIITAIGKSFSLANIIFILLGALQIGTVEFYIGTGLFLLGLGFLVASIIHYRNAAMDKPITNAQALQLLDEYDKKAVIEIFESMENTRQLTKKYVSANLTFKSWMRMRKSHNPNFGVKQTKENYNPTV